ncbi:MAG: serine/threonine protein kinase [Gammaproteobacteria bacterium]|nr:serine/threonine protein kinase [Gammaproteobacteria bacterium]
MNDTNTEPDFAQLAPDNIIDAIESLDMRCDARIFPLNSYENRVYQIGIEDQQPVIAKFYRPHRWTDEQILEEHHFTEELARLEIPVVAPLCINGQTLIHTQAYRLALYPRRGGRVAELDNLEHLAWISRFIGRIHAVGSTTRFKLRPDISIQAYATEPSNHLLANDFIPDYLNNAYQTLIEDLLKLLEQRFDASAYRFIRLHGDCHAGNILWTDKGPHFVDFDDSRNGPAIQDLWMMLSGNHNDQQEQLHRILDSYSEFYDFNPAEISLIEPLRTLRIIHYAGWLAQRWQDPAFPASFPWFNTPNYWEQHILELREQFSLLQENEEFST